jgi:hypothetical protein
LEYVDPGGGCGITGAALWHVRQENVPTAG